MGEHHEALEGHVSEPTRIVLFGPNGQVGARLMATLALAGYEVTGIDRARCDLASATPKDIAVIIRAVEPALVINATAYNAVDAAEGDAAMAERINGEIPTLMAHAAAEQGVPFLHFSTDYVFDGARGAPYREDASVNPVNAYAISKRAGELGVRAHGGHVFRLQWLFDARGKNFFLTMKKLLAEREEVRVVADQLGAPSNALHIARAVTQAAPKLIDGSVPADIYHLSSGGYQLARLCLRHCGSYPQRRARGADWYGGISHPCRAAERFAAGLLGACQLRLCHATLAQRINPSHK